MHTEPWFQLAICMDLQAVTALACLVTSNSGLSPVVHHGFEPEGAPCGDESRFYSRL